VIGFTFDLAGGSMCAGCASRPSGIHGHSSLREALVALTRGRRYQPLVRVLCPACGTRWVRLRSRDRTYSWHTLA
jgi:hypothetical protein